MSSIFSFETMWKIWLKYSSFYWDGVKNTLLVSFFAVLMGVCLGLLIAGGRMWKPANTDGSLKKTLKGVVRFLCTAYVEVLRATPLMVQVMIIYFGASAAGLKFSDTNFTILFWGLISVSLNSGAYLSEVIRSGIGAVEGGQLEAAHAIGLTQRQAMRYVILPQAIRNILPALANEFVTMIKETSVLNMIGLHEIMFRAGDVRAATYRSLECYVIAAILYFIIVFPLSKLVAAFERRMSKSVTR